jgi:hypothetical protein
VIFTIETPKPPEDIWPVLIDFSARLDTEDGEQITGVSLSPYRLDGYSDVLATIDTEGAERVILITEYPGFTGNVYSYRLAGRPGQIKIAPEPGNAEGEPPYTCVVFKIQRGTPGYSYAAYITVITNKDNRHSCVVRWRVEELA